MRHTCQSKRRVITLAEMFIVSTTKKYLPNNGASFTIIQIIKAVMSLAAKVEVRALFLNAQEAIPVRAKLEEMDRPQLPKPIQTDNLTGAAGIAKNKEPRRLKSMDMKHWWLRDRETQGQFRFFWRPGSFNLGDYFTKHHPGPHHVHMRKEFITPRRHLEDLRRRREKARLGAEFAQAMSDMMCHATRVC